MKPEYVVLSFIGAFLIAVILAWRKFQAVDRQFARMQQEINELRWMESRLFLMEVNAKRAADRTDAVSQKGVAANDAAASVKSATLSTPE
jgi:type II secretory pathway component PulM